MKYKILDRAPVEDKHPFADIVEVNGEQHYYFGQWMWLDFEGTPECIYVVIMDDGRAIVETGAGELKDAGIKLRRVPAVKPPARWPPWSVKKFIEGEEPNPSEMEVYDICKETYERYIDYGDEWGASMLLSLYTIQTYLMPIFNSTAYIAISGGMRSGKSRNLDIAEQLCFNAIKTENITSAALFRVVDTYRSTILVDESDFTSPEKHREILIMLRAGYRRGAYVVREARVQRKGEEKFKEEFFDTFGPKIIVVPEGLETMLRDRSIFIVMQRTRNMEITKRIIDRSDKTFEDIRAHLYWFALKHWRDVLKEYRELSTPEIQSREYEKWSPILSIAKVFGVYDEIYNYAMEKIHETYLEEEAESPVVKLLRVALFIAMKSRGLETQVYRTASEIATECEELSIREKWVKPQTIGYLLTNVLGLNKKPYKVVSGGQARYLLDEKKLKALAEKYGINPDKPLGE